MPSELVFNVLHLHGDKQVYDAIPTLKDEMESYIQSDEYCQRVRPKQSMVSNNPGHKISTSSN